MAALVNSNMIIRILSILLYIPISSSETPMVLLISLDGLRYDFVDEKLTPNIWRLGLEGVYAPFGLKSQVMTVTTPNHQCMATGLYQESHGVVDNVFYDPQFGEFYDNWNFTKNSTRAAQSLKSKWYLGGTPIWRANMKIKNRKSGCLLWPVCDAEYPEDGAPPHKAIPWKDYGNFSVWSKEVDQILDWFLDKRDPINLGLYYIAQPDHAEHEDDLYGNVVRSSIREVDNAIGYLIGRISDIDYLKNNLNLILTADHGHAQIPDQSHVFNISHYVDPTLTIRSSASFFPRLDLNINEDEIYENLTRARKDGVRIQVWRKKDFPERYHWKNNRRIGPVIFFEELHFINNDSPEPGPRRKFPHGSHGSLNDHLQMRPFFVARGPAFKTKYRLSGRYVENIDLYPLMCKILGVETPPDNNGSLIRIGQILKDYKLDEPQGSQWSLLLFSIALPALAIMVSFLMIVLYIRRNSTDGRQKAANLSVSGENEYKLLRSERPSGQARVDQKLLFTDSSDNEEL